MMMMRNMVCYGRMLQCMLQCMLLLLQVDCMEFPPSLIINDDAVHPPKS
jgi:hypothetical protein